MKQYFVPNVRTTDSKCSNDQLVYISKVTVADRNHPRTMHAHDDLVEVILITEGSGDIFIGDRYFPIQQGDLVVYNSKVVHDELFSSRPVSLYCLGFKQLQATELRKNALIADDSQPIFQTNHHFDLLESWFASAFTLLETEVVNYDTLTQKISDLILLYLRGNIFHQSKKNTTEENKLAIVREIKAYIDIHFSDDFKLKDLKGQGRWSINEYYFAHKFKELYNYSPIEYIQRRRIGEAQTMLINTDLSLTAIAHQVGFNSSAYFSTLFKKMVNMTPKDYRNIYTMREISQTKKQDSEKTSQ